MIREKDVLTFPEGIGPKKTPDFHISIVPVNWQLSRAAEIHKKYSGRPNTSKIHLSLQGRGEEIIQTLRMPQTVTMFMDDISSMYVMSVNVNGKYYLAFNPLLNLVSSLLENAEEFEKETLSFTSLDKGTVAGGVERGFGLMPENLLASLKELKLNPMLKVLLDFSDVYIKSIYHGAFLGESIDKWNKPKGLFFGTERLNELYMDCLVKGSVMFPIDTEIHNIESFSFDSDVLTLIGEKELVFCANSFTKSVDLVSNTYNSTLFLSPKAQGYIRAQPELRGLYSKGPKFDSCSSGYFKNCIERRIFSNNILIVGEQNPDTFREYYTVTDVTSCINFYPGLVGASDFSCDSIGTTFIKPMISSSDLLSILSSKMKEAWVKENPNKTNYAVAY